MNNKQLSSEFSSKAGERILEIFLLPDAARKEFNKMQEQDAKELARLHDELQARKADDLRAAKREIMAERPKPEPAPPWKSRKGRNESDLEISAERLVEARNAAIIRTLEHKHIERQDTFLSRHREERLLREAQESNAMRDGPLSPSLKRDFEQSR
ncbi:TPA: hypothetical protein N2C61_006472 [Pseudomonas aeruginosa]|uniref:hypothetical protein n=1 Tax=Alcaligenes xylosoxydans xylosoxydans TaxID=85698 RepID=UPI000AE3FD45|nr:hypothetical protein [Achromobacter xylosoxidans]HCL4135307.1 hypothetical protein [Pseudomonas aeruginosa]